MLLKKVSPLFLILTLAFVSSCLSMHEIHDSASDILLRAVPFYPQESYQCGPASLAMVMNYRNVLVKPEEIAEDIYSRSARGTLNLDMVLYAQHKGLSALQYKGNLNDLKKNIDSGNPLIVLVDYGFSFYQSAHFMVVVGYNENRRNSKFRENEGTFYTRKGIYEGMGKDKLLDAANTAEGY